MRILITGASGFVGGRCVSRYAQTGQLDVHGIGRRRLSSPNYTSVDLAQPFDVPFTPDVVIHAAAMKQVPACEYNPFEAVQTNIIGAKNVIDVAIDNGVERVVAVSTDKAVSPVNLYGATKLVAEKLFVQGNVYAGGAGCG